jgi:hypothetical protein
LVQKDCLLFSTEFARLQSSIIDEPEMKDSNEPAPLLDTTCHCLMVDESLVPGGDMKEAMAKILSTTIQSAVYVEARAGPGASACTHPAERHQQHDLRGP